MAGSDAVALSWDRIANGIADTIDPVGGSPDGPLATSAFLESFGTSLMPRNTLHQGIVTGLCLSSARSASWIVERATDTVAPRDSGPASRIATRTVVGAAGVGLSRLGSRDIAPGGSMAPAVAGAFGSVLAGAALGGSLHDVRNLLVEHTPTRRPITNLATSVVAAGAASWWARQRLRRRREEIERWPVEQAVTQWRSTLIGVGVTLAGAGGARLVGATRRGLTSYLGPGATKAVLATGATGVLWVGGAIGAYNGIVQTIGKANSKVDPGYSTPPTKATVSGSPTSAVRWDDLGQQGRRYVGDVTTAEQIGTVMGTAEAQEPIRVFVGYQSEPLYPSQRAELALAELDRTGAFDRSHLLLVAPTGTGWVDHTMIEAAEFLARGDIATCCIQYGISPSFLAVQKLQLGRAQFRLLLWGVGQRLAAVPEADRPKVLVFGESLGAWASSDVVMHQGIAGFDHYGIDKALWVGLPGLAKWSRNGMTKGASELVPTGTVGVFDRHEQLAALSPDDRAKLRAVILSHDNDPIARLSPELLVQRPDWLDPEVERGRGVPDSMRYRPFITFWHTLVDAMNAMVVTPGEFGAFGHDYRGPMARFVRDAFEMPETDDATMARLEAALRTAELERASKIKGHPEDPGEAAPEPAVPGPSGNGSTPDREAGA